MWLLELSKDALLCLIICTTLANMRKNKKFTFVSLAIVVICFLMGIDFW